MALEKEMLEPAQKAAKEITAVAGFVLVAEDAMWNGRTRDIDTFLTSDIHTEVRRWLANTPNAASRVLSVVLFSGDGGYARALAELRRVAKEEYGVTMHIEVVSWMHTLSYVERAGASLDRIATEIHNMATIARNIFVEKRTFSWKELEPMLS
jgi:hypothetical protein